jgi:predicted transcriptional regulator
MANVFAKFCREFTMPRKPSPQLTEVELQVLQILWEHGPSPVRTIHAELRKLRDTNYSTTVKMLSVMLDKQLVERTEEQRPHIYSASVSRHKAQRQMLRSLIDRIYQGSATSLILRALASTKASPQEIAQIRQMLNRIEGDAP